MAVVNAVLNQVFIFELGLGVAGAGWATGAAQLVGVALGVALFLSAPVRREYDCHRCWRSRPGALRRAVATGLADGPVPRCRSIGLALFQVMLAALGAVSRAATQIVMMMSFIAYMPAVGIASAGTTLVGQSIGADDRAWATKVGNAAIRVNVAYMGLVSLTLALAGPWLLPCSSRLRSECARSGPGGVLLWIGAAYQIFDGINLGAGFCLRGRATCACRR